MTILAVLQDVSLAVGLARPLAVFSSTDREWLEMQSIANEAAATIAEDYDWQLLRKVATLSGTGSAESFTLPTDYARMMKTASLWSSRFLWSNEHIDSDDWLAMDTWPVAPLFGSWTIFGGEFHYKPVMASGATARFFYIKNVIVSGSKTAFTADTDTFLLDERLLKLCTIYLWKQRKGQDFAAELADYEIAIERAKDRDGGSKPIVSGNRMSTRDRRCSNVWPGTVTG